MNKLISLTPKEEASIIAYVALYYNCDKEDCWKTIGDIILKYGRINDEIVYRGHSKKDDEIKNISPFFSTSPKKKMAELFVETDFDLPKDKQKIGHLFKIHLHNVPHISTRDVQFTFTDEVKEELRKINKNRIIEKGGGNVTFEEFFPRIKPLIDELVCEDKDSNGEEYLILNGGTFYKNKDMTIKGYKKVNNTDFETWYSFNKNKKIVSLFTNSKSVKRKSNKRDVVTKRVNRKNGRRKSKNKSKSKSKSTSKSKP
jgi:hypothetical protein